VEDVSDAYRDALEALLARVRDLEREVEELRKRNAGLESIGQTDEARENARRLAAALERELEEARIRHERTLDDATWKQAALEASTYKPSTAAKLASAAGALLLAAFVTVICSGRRRVDARFVLSCAGIFLGLAVLFAASSLVLRIRARKR
jgi:hypothetical protein